MKYDVQQVNCKTYLMFRISNYKESLYPGILLTLSIDLIMYLFVYIFYEPAVFTITDYCLELMLLSSSMFFFFGFLATFYVFEIKFPER